MITLVITAIFINLYFILKSVHDHYIHIDIINHSDFQSPERSRWHAASFGQTVLLLLFLCACMFLDLQFNFSIWTLVLLFLLSGSIMLNNFRNILDGKSVLYVEKDNFISGKVHWIADKIGVPAEMLMLAIQIGFLILLILSLKL